MKKQVLSPQLIPALTTCLKEWNNSFIVFLKLSEGIYLVDYDVYIADDTIFIVDGV